MNTDKTSTAANWLAVLSVAALILTIFGVTEGGLGQAYPSLLPHWWVHYTGIALYLFSFVVVLVFNRAGALPEYYVRDSLVGLACGWFLPVGVAIFIKVALRAQPETTFTPDTLIKVAYATGVAMTSIPVITMACLALESYGAPHPQHKQKVNEARDELV